MSEIKITIDGTEVSGHERMTILEAAERVGIEIPTLCHKPEITPAGAKNVKMVQVGGATGRVIPCAMTDTLLSYETVLGSGFVTVFDETRDIIDFVCPSMGFLAEESCGKCSPCRKGTEVMLEILGRLARGEGVQEDIQALEALSNVVIGSSLCGLGQAAPIPVLDTLKYFRSGYENRINRYS